MQRNTSNWIHFNIKQIGERFLIIYLDVLKKHTVILCESDIEHNPEIAKNRHMIAWLQLHHEENWEKLLNL